jgi:alpha-N-arabinofuranosidase
LTDGPKMVLTPTYHVYHLYVPFQGARVVPVTFDAGTYALGDIRLPRVDAVAARDPSGKLWLALTNVDPNRPAKLTAAVAGARGATGRVLTGVAVDSHNNFAAPNAVAPKPYSGRLSGGQLQFDLPPKSVAVVQIH